MKILAFTDIHGSFSAFQNIEKLVKKEDPDLLIDCGDISIFENELEYLVGRIAKLGKPCLIIHGNHEGLLRFEEACKKYKNMIFLHNKIHCIGNYVFFGWGGGGFSLNDRDFDLAAKKHMKNIKKEDKLVLFTHAPPYGTRTDEMYGEHVGNKSIRRFIEKHKPIIALCGHLHEDNGTRDKIGKTKVINPGPDGKIIVI